MRQPSAGAEAAVGRAAAGSGGVVTGGRAEPTVLTAEEQAEAARMICAVVTEVRLGRLAAIGHREAVMVAALDAAATALQAGWNRP